MCATGNGHLPVVPQVIARQKRPIVFPAMRAANLVTLMPTKPPGEQQTGKTEKTSSKAPVRRGE